MSAHSQDINLPKEPDETDTCLVDFTKYTFPQKWGPDAIDSVYWITSISNNQLFASLSIVPQQKLSVLPRKKSTANRNLIDSAYYCNTMSSTKKYTLNIYKSGSKYDSERGGEMVEPIDYLLLATLDAKGRMIDYLVCHYFVYRAYESSERYFYMDDNRIITLVNFYSDEEETRFLGRCTYRIDERGRFILCPKAGELKNKRIKQYVL